MSDYLDTTIGFELDDPGENFGIVTNLHFAKGYRQQALENQYSFGFVNGCFDMLHLGHFWLLNEAKKHCHYLWVGLNDDAYIKKTKGDDRPFMNLVQRVYMLKSLDAVTGVTVYTSSSCSELIKELKPDVLIKSSEWNDVYTLDSRTEEEIDLFNCQEPNPHIEKKIHVVENIPDFSTTNLRAKFAKSLES